MTITIVVINMLWAKSKFQFNWTSDWDNDKLFQVVAFTFPIIALLTLFVIQFWVTLICTLTITTIFILFKTEQGKDLLAKLLSGRNSNHIQSEHEEYEESQGREISSNSCPICRKTVRNDKSSNRCDHCGLLFHSDCLLRWCESSGRRTCPHCHYRLGYI